ncbi:MAG TPA: type II toxin-antitoxin system prevent-host-death family antitoxin [Candidatus Angelobacter sp.]|jgi:prevent-host-death family protein|nr:type II toxin-antitoxin system prevent-host-death family antitoxin [Candidatus Angelobacter sp.]
MQKVGLFEAKQKLSELVERAVAGERTGITRRGQLAAIIGPARPQYDLKTIFKELEGIRKRTRRMKNTTIKELIEEGRS